MDLASRSVGWAYFEGDQLRSAGTWDLLKNRQPGDGAGARWIRMLRCLNGLIDVSKLAIDRVAYEEVTFESGSVYASHKWGGAEAILEMWLESRGFKSSQVVKIHVAAVKALAVGKGGGKGTQKESILEAARRRKEWSGINFPDDNAADAAFVGLAAILGVTKPAIKKKKPSKAQAGKAGHRRKSENNPTLFPKNT